MATGTAPRIVVEVHATKVTTRDGTHPDDRLYISEIKMDLEMRMKNYGFHNAKVDVRFEVPNENTYAHIPEPTEPLLPT